MMKRIMFDHPALYYCDPKTGEYDEEKYDEMPIEFPAQWEICWNCGGDGSHVRRDIDDSALIDSMSEDGDFEGIESYFRGAYDVRCNECRGTGKVLTPILPEWAAKRIRDWEYEQSESDRIQEAERRMGA